jgi:DNA-directed RNA polymerase subunit RPC12/RpoP
MQAIAVKCPNCAARLEVGEAARTATCTYCGTTSRILARTRFLERPIAAPPLAQELHMPVAIHPHSVLWLVAVVFAILLVGGLLAGRLISSAVTAISEQVSPVDEPALEPAGEPADEPADEPRLWLSPGILAADVTGDGVGDAIGWVEMAGSKQLAIAAFAGSGGERLWVRPIGARQERERGILALAGDLVLVADPLGVVRGFAAADGTPRWQAAIGERVSAFCFAEGAALLRTRDERWHHLDLVAGERGEAEEPERCRPLPDDRDSWGASKQYGYHAGLRGRYRWTDGVPSPRRLAGMSVSEVVEVEAGAEAAIWLALGHKEPGTRVPMLARYSVEGAGSDREFPVSWAVEVPAGDPLRAKEDAPERITVTGGRVFVGYAMADGSPRLAAFDLGSGERRFDMALPHRSSHRLDHAVAADRRVFVKDGSTMVAIDTESGAVVFSIGE